MISVCMPTYNGGKYIKKQMDSILGQLGDFDEVIISDDSSNDETIQILKTYQDPRINILEHQRFKNPIYNLENALIHAKGEYILMADQDDIWKPHKVRVMSEQLANYDLVIGDCEVIDKDDKIVYNSFFKEFNKGKGLIKNFISDSYLGCNMAFNRKILKMVLPFPKDIPLHDVWIGTIGELLGRIYFCPQVLMQYRRHDENYSYTCESSRNSLLRKIHFRINLLKNILSRVFKVLVSTRFKQEVTTV